jgi:hypothetical protein
LTQRGAARNRSEVNRRWQDRHVKAKPITENALRKNFIARYGAAITGVLSGFDRLRFRALYAPAKRVWRLLALLHTPF